VQKMYRNVICVDNKISKSQIVVVLQRM
jgi:hypothetical protein